MKGKGNKPMATRPLFVKSQVPNMKPIITEAAPMYLINTISSFESCPSGNSIALHIFKACSGAASIHNPKMMIIIITDNFIGSKACLQSMIKTMLAKSCARYFVLITVVV
mmetsp:Transcript_34796/g.50833  ORF Transcript_34796/g.50833 Transcript_34796/m.50833 type:complete len:110 (-) Transcript_34796:150-479(-)